MQAIKFIQRNCSWYCIIVENGEKRKKHFLKKWTQKKEKQYKNGENKLKKNLMIGMKEGMNSLEKHNLVIGMYAALTPNCIAPLSSATQVLLVNL